MRRRMEVREWLVWLLISNKITSNPKERPGKDALATSHVVWCRRVGACCQERAEGFEVSMGGGPIEWSTIKLQDTG